MKYLIYEDKGDGVGLLTINRPEALNALNSAVVAELDACLTELAGKGLCCLVLTGAGPKSFVAGADIGEMSKLDCAGAKAFSIAGASMMNKIEDFPCPVIAAVNGFALGGGLEIALACDIRLAGEKASFALPEVGLGLLPGYDGVERLTRLIGSGRAKELVYTTDRIKADEAYRIGLVNHVYAQDELLGKALEMAGKIAANAPLGVAAAKRLSNGSVGLTLKEAECMAAGEFGKIFASADMHEGTAAFVEKRAHAPYTGK